MRKSTILLCLTLTACGDSKDPQGPTGDPPDFNTDDAGPATVSYRLEVAPIFFTHCIACHYTGSEMVPDLQNPFGERGPIGMANTWPEAKNKVVVVPGKPEESALIDKIDASELDEHTDGSKMPLVLPDITQAEVDTLVSWVNAGAAPGEQFDSEVAPIFGNGTGLGRARGRCSWCHSTGSFYKPDLTKPFDETVGLKDLVVPGDADMSVLIQRVKDTGPDHMPKVFPRLTAEEVATVETWIREGARNN